jgi:hypothetical protein
MPATGGWEKSPSNLSLVGGLVKGTTVAGNIFGTFYQK